MSAEDKATNKRNKITITNDKGRMSKEEIELMVPEAEKYKAEDDAQKEDVEARNQLENFFSNAKDMAGVQLGDKMSPDDKAVILKASKGGFERLDSHQDASKSEIEGCPPPS